MNGSDQQANRTLLSEPELARESELNARPIRLDALLLRLASASVVCLLTICAATFSGWACLRYLPVSDPVDIVGVPLLAGYSERAELFSFYGFALGAVVFGMFFRSVVSRSSHRWVARAGLASWFVLAGLLPVWFAPTIFGGAVFLGFLALWIIRWALPRCESRHLFSIGCVSSAIAASLASPQSWLELQHFFCLVGAIVVLVFAWSVAQNKKSQPKDLRLFFWSISVATVLLLISLVGNIQWNFIASGALLILIAGRLPSLEGKFTVSQFWPWFLAPLVFVFALWYFLIPAAYVWYQPAMSTGIGIALGFLILLAWSYLPLGNGAKNLVVKLKDHWPTIRMAVPTVAWLLVLLGILRVGFERPWFCLMACTLTILCAATEWVFVLRRGGLLFAATILFLFTFLPTLNAKQGTEIDPFHDGQIRSAVWEFESGRQLFSDVFPLRMQEFWTTWLADEFCEPDLASYLLVREWSKALSILGVFAFLIVWTKSPLWSLACSIAFSLCMEFDARIGLQLLLAAFSLRLILAQTSLNCEQNAKSTMRREDARNGRRAFFRYSLLVVVGAFSIAMGFDSLLVVIGPTAGVLFFLSLERFTKRKDWRSLFLSIQPPVVYGLGSAGLFSAIIFAFHGWESVATYWQMFFAFAKNYPAFYGLPLPWHAADLRTMIAVGMLSLACIFSFGVMATDASWRARARWVFLFLLVAMISHRAIGRSDRQHLTAILHPAFLVVAIGIWELVGAMQQTWLTLRGNRLQWVYALMIAIGCWLCPVATESPITLRSDFVALRVRTNLIHKEAALQANDISSNAYLWSPREGLKNYLWQRHNPTRHAIAYCIGWPEEQVVALEELRRHPPAQIDWTHNSETDGMAEPLRYYVIASELYERYAPSEATSALKAKPADWMPMGKLPEVLQGPLFLGKLAITWGNDLPRLQSFQLAAKNFSGWRSSKLSEGKSPAWSSEWTADLDVNPREFNYLLVRASCQPFWESVNSNSPVMDLARRAFVQRQAVELFSDQLPSLGVILFGEQPSQFDSASPVVYWLRRDGTEATYLIPIGCSASWSYRSRIRSLKIYAPSGSLLSLPKTEFLQIDERQRARPAGRKS